MAHKKSIDIRKKGSDRMLDLDEIESNIKIKEPFDFRGASMTLILVIIAIWSAYFVTLLISGKPLPKLPISNKSSQKVQTTKTDDTSTTLTKKEGAPALPDSSTTTSQESSLTPLTPGDANSLIKTTEIAKDSFKIRILNGNGVTGAAVKTKDSLASKGFNIGDVGNAKLQYTKTNIYYLKDKKAEAELVKTNLGNNEAVLEEAQSDLIGDGYQVLIVLGAS